jgi:hypothetical protein
MTDDMTRWIHPGKIVIDRDRVTGDGSPDGTAVLMDAGGNDIEVFSQEWTDDQIRWAVVLANRAYQAGVDDGQKAKAAEIRNALGAEEKPPKGFHCLGFKDQNPPAVSGPK